MNGSPTFSVIIPTYNRAHMLPRSIGSVLKQDFDDFEVVVVNDNSSDDTEEVVQSFDDDRIVYVRRTENGSASAARNTGIRKAQGTYVSLLDDDDEYEPEFLSRTYEAFEQAPEDVEWGWSGIKRVKDTPQGEEVGQERVWQLPRFESLEESFMYMLKRVGVATSYGVTIKRSLFDRVGMFDEAFTAQEDADITIRLARHARYLVVPHALVKIHAHAGPNLTSFTERGAKDYSRLLDKLLPVLRKDRDLWCQYHYKVGHMWYGSGHRDKGRHYITKALTPLTSPHARKVWLALGMYELLGARSGRRIHQLLSGKLIATRKKRR